MKSALPKKILIPLALASLLSLMLMATNVLTGYSQPNADPGVVDQIIPSDRRINWNPGMAIPYYSVVANVRDYGAVPNDGKDDRQAIQDAIYAARDAGGGAVYLPAGAYDIKSRTYSDGALYLPSNIVLRGDGPKATFLKFNLGAYSDAVAGIKILAWDYGDFVSATGGYNHGSTSITVANASSFKAGDYAEILETNDSTIDGASWAQDAVGEMVKITSVSGNRLGIEQPLHYTYQAGRNPRIRRVGMVTRSGVENLHLKRLDKGPGQMILLYNAAFVWLKNIESEYVLESHVLGINTYHCEIRDSYFHDSWGYGGGGQGYGVNLEKHSTSCLVENNIFRNFRHSIVVQVGASGNVFGYNYSTDKHNYLTDVSVHGHFASYNLFEGNIMQEVNDSDAWGMSGPGNTFLRNCVQKEGIQIKNKSHTQNIVGNVLSWNPNIIQIDPGVQDTLVHGNYQEEMVQWDPGISDHNIPNSYYLGGKPSFFGGMSWPSINPLSHPNSNDCVNPAQQRWLQQATPTPTPPPGTPVPTNTPGPTSTPTATVTPTAPPTATPVGQILTNAPARADAYISEWYPDTNYGSGVLRVRNGDVEQSLLQFDLASLPANIQIDEAKLRLWVSGRSNTNNLTGDVYALRRAWNEHQVTQKQAAAGVAWQSPGAHGDVDRDPSRIDSRRLPASGPVTWDVTDVVRGWYGTPSSNHGLILGATTVNGNVEYSFVGREGAADERPVLLVRYRQSTVTATPPTPTSSPTFTPTPAPTSTPNRLWLPVIRR